MLLSRVLADRPPSVRNASLKRLRDSTVIPGCLEPAECDTFYGTPALIPDIFHADSRWRIFALRAGRRLLRISGRVSWRTPTVIAIPPASPPSFTPEIRRVCSVMHDVSNREHNYPSHRFSGGKAPLSEVNSPSNARLKSVNSRYRYCDKRTDWTICTWTIAIERAMCEEDVISY